MPKICIFFTCAASSKKTAHTSLKRSGVAHQVLLKLVQYNTATSDQNPFPMDINYLAEIYLVPEQLCQFVRNLPLLFCH